MATGGQGVDYETIDCPDTVFVGGLPYDMDESQFIAETNLWPHVTKQYYRGLHACWGTVTFESNSKRTAFLADKRGKYLGQKRVDVKPFLKKNVHNAPVVIGQGKVYYQTTKENSRNNSSTPPPPSKVVQPPPPSDAFSHAQTGVISRYLGPDTGVIRTSKYGNCVFNREVVFTCSVHSRTCKKSHCTDYKRHTDHHGSKSSLFVDLPVGTPVNFLLRPITVSGGVYKYQATMLWPQLSKKPPDASKLSLDILDKHLLKLKVLNFSDSTDEDDTDDDDSEEDSADDDEEDRLGAEMDQLLEHMTSVKEFIAAEFSLDLDQVSLYLATSVMEAESQEEAVKCLVEYAEKSLGLHVDEAKKKAIEDNYRKMKLSGHVNNAGAIPKVKKHVYYDEVLLHAAFVTFMYCQEEEVGEKAFEVAEEVLQMWSLSGQQLAMLANRFDEMKEDSSSRSLMVPFVNLVTGLIKEKCQKNNDDPLFNNISDNVRWLVKFFLSDAYSQAQEEEEQQQQQGCSLKDDFQLSVLYHVVKFSLTKPKVLMQTIAKVTERLGKHHGVDLVAENQKHVKAKVTHVFRSQEKDKDMDRVAEAFFCHVTQEREKKSRGGNFEFQGFEGGLEPTAQLAYMDKELNNMLLLRPDFGQLADWLRRNYDESCPGTSYLVVKYWNGLGSKKSMSELELEYYENGNLLKNDTTYEWNTNRVAKVTGKFFWQKLNLVEFMDGNSETVFNWIFDHNRLHIGIIGHMFDDNVGVVFSMMGGFLFNKSVACKYNDASWQRCEGCTSRDLLPGTWVQFSGIGDHGQCRFVTEMWELCGLETKETIINMTMNNNGSLRRPGGQAYWKFCWKNFKHYMNVPNENFLNSFTETEFWTALNKLLSIKPRNTSSPVRKPVLDSYEPYVAAMANLPATKQRADLAVLLASLNLSLSNIKHLCLLHYAVGSGPESIEESMVNLLISANVYTGEVAVLRHMDMFNYYFYQHDEDYRDRMAEYEYILKNRSGGNRKYMEAKVKIVSQLLLASEPSDSSAHSCPAIATGTDVVVQQGKHSADIDTVKVLEQELTSLQKKVEGMDQEEKHFETTINKTISAMLGKMGDMAKAIKELQERQGPTTTKMGMNGDVPPNETMYVRVSLSDNLDIHEFPTDKGGNLCFEAVQALYPGINALKYKTEDGKSLRLCRKIDNIFEAPDGGWGSRLYYVNLSPVGSSPAILGSVMTTRPPGVAAPYNFSMPPHHAGPPVYYNGKMT